MPESDYLADEPGYRQWVGGREPMCTVVVDGVTREGYIRAVSLRPDADPPGWYANVVWSTGLGSTQPTWFLADDVTEVPEPSDRGVDGH